MIKHGNHGIFKPAPCPLLYFVEMSSDDEEIATINALSNTEFFISILVVCQPKNDGYILTRRHRDTKTRGRGEKSIIQNNLDRLLASHSYQKKGVCATF
ncbi:MAG: hypothetical protein PUP91_24770 [Rhizonema sp. PD37]|nr:hypothetical protein [Rhizonema sp. PD37]